VRVRKRFANRLAIIEVVSVNAKGLDSVLQESLYRNLEQLQIRVEADDNDADLRD
jgi:hypothetical protein